MDLQTRTNNKIVECQNAQTHEWTFENGQESRKYAVFPAVFSPAIFLGTRFLTSEVLKHPKSGQKMLEIGTGCGVTAIEVALRVKDCEIYASDLSEQAIKNTQFNMQRHGVKFWLGQSDRFKSIPEMKFDIIYWNYPFHPTKFQHNTILEKGIRDPGYQMLDTYFAQAHQWLKEGGCLLLGFSDKMGNVELFRSLAEKWKWRVEKLADMDPKEGSMSLYKLAE